MQKADTISFAVRIYGACFCGAKVRILHHICRYIEEKAECHCNIKDYIYLCSPERE